MTIGVEKTCAHYRDLLCFLFGYLFLLVMRSCVVYMYDHYADVIWATVLIG